ncbi:MAG: SPOR domain-containing protein [Caldimonas sp.]|jgi:cell division protein FtsN|uniref:SPOR domain-containing protein n=1 Tax=Caldimonas sp. TaxID=2838790 RepID=UPI003918F55F
MNKQRGGFALGLVVGVLVGLALALAVALYVTKVPIPFVNKVPSRTAEQEAAEAERNRHWNPNAPLQGRSAAPSAPAASQPLPDVPPGLRQGTARPAPRDPAAILSGADPAPAAVTEAPAVYFVQAGAFTRADEAEQQRARLAMLGLSARVSEREQSGRTVYRVRLGPFDTQAEADRAQDRLKSNGIDAALVRAPR